MRYFFILSIVIIFLCTLLIFFYPLIRKIYVAKFFERINYKKIYQIAKNCDYYLINKLELPLDEKRVAHIDHLLFGNKFIYLITSVCFFGTFAGTEEDDTWFYYPYKGAREYKKNPLILNKIRVEKLSLVTGIEESLIKSIVVVNDDCNIEHLALSSQSDMIVSMRGLSRLVRKFEKSDIPPIQGEQLQQAVLDIHVLTKRKP